MYTFFLSGRWRHVADLEMARRPRRLAHTAVSGNNIVRARLMQELAAGATTYAVFMASKRSLLTWRDNRRVCGKPPSGLSRSTPGGLQYGRGTPKCRTSPAQTPCKMSVSRELPKMQRRLSRGFHGSVDIGATGDKCPRCLRAAVAGHRLVLGGDTATETPGT